MGYKEFIEKVAEMRNAQKAYANSPSPTTFLKSKKLETDIDNEIEHFKRTTGCSKQLSLFDIDNNK